MMEPSVMLEHRSNGHGLSPSLKFFARLNGAVHVVGSGFADTSFEAS